MKVDQLGRGGPVNCLGADKTAVFRGITRQNRAQDYHTTPQSLQGDFLSDPPVYPLFHIWRSIPLLTRQLKTGAILHCPLTCLFRPSRRRLTLQWAKPSRIWLFLLRVSNGKLSFVSKLEWSRFIRPIYLSPGSPAPSRRSLNATNQQVGVLQTLRGVRQADK